MVVNQRNIEFWSNKSVLDFAKGSDPVDKIIADTRNLVIRALDKGWRGPPFDPFWLASFLKIRVFPSQEVFDSHVETLDGGTIIRYNPSKPMSRVRFSIAHEIAHTFFPDYYKSIRNRSHHSNLINDEWQLEVLCNIAAAEILMPSISLPNLENLSLERIIRIREEFEVSQEAAMIRAVHLTSEPVAMFSASRTKEVPTSDFRIDYVIKSPSFSLEIPLGLEIGKESVISECTAIGFTAVGKEKWMQGSPMLHVECIGAQPIGSGFFPRVIGFLRTSKKSIPEKPSIEYLWGDATEPRGSQKKIIVQIVNDRTPKWGRGFGGQIARKWPEIQARFIEWSEENEFGLELGETLLSRIDKDTNIFHIIAQKGIGPSKFPRIRYEALKKGLLDLQRVAIETNASVHLPPIGTGYGGGDWGIIKEMLNTYLIQKGINVTVYYLPSSDSQTSRKKEVNLDTYICKSQS